MIHPHRRSTILAAAGLLAAAMGHTVPAAAQTIEPSGVAIDRYEPPEPGDPFMAVPSPSIGGHLVPRLMLTYDVAYIPFEVEDSSGELIPVIWGMQVLHANASLALWDRLMVGVGMPIVVDQGPGLRQTTIDGGVYSMPNGAAAGDFRASLRGRIVGEYEDPFQLSVGSYFYFPTGPDNSYVSEGSFYAHPHLLLGGRARPFIWSASGGTMLRTSGNPHAVTFGGAAGLLLFDDLLQIGPEVTGQVALDDWEIYPAYGTSALSFERVNAEVLGSATTHIANMFTAGVAGGAGLTNAPGTPDGRALLRFGYAPQPEPEREAGLDADGDRIEDDVDACPKTPGVADVDPAKHGCPRPKDQDGDGIVDAEDACPERAGKASDDPAKHGCPRPSDRDDDGILDEDDACPDEPGESSDQPVIHGCPRTTNRDDCVYEDEPCPEAPADDRDGDGVDDDRDKCPDVPGTAARGGCPAPRPTPPTPTPSAAGNHPELEAQRVRFDFNAASLRPESAGALDEMARYLRDHDEIKLVEVQGHADETGPAGYNQQLSWQRANAVSAALVRRGVSAARLRSVGYGEARPEAANDTEGGRQQNRRVQLRVLR
ncbi:MAG: OmpA family protein [Deltaproteobacteria bacterium]|jgi:outer membrane protein OmpA-like peptidoglycan-associated protein|nr:OmpA family protein [Deltaproteobacteria bacterium]MBW2530652.1 OmpA family protein [Deltaproteobacteria bacterium]